MPLPIRKRIIEHCSMLRLLKPEHIQQPDKVENAIAGLTVQAGWKCRAYVYCCVSENNMLEHNKQRHRWTKAVGAQWQPATVQTLFGGPRRHFFEVTVIAGMTEKTTTLLRR